jgi:outer membrane protein assembly factor BamB
MLSAQDWPQWRGPSRTGVAAGFKAPAAWPERPTQVWKVQAGIGHSSPIVASNRVFLFSRIGEEETLTSFELGNGKQLWRQSYGAAYDMNPAARGHGKGPKSTPVADRGRIFTFGISGVLTAWDAKDGRQVWRKDFAKEFSTGSPIFGVAMSPVVAGDSLIVHAGGESNGALMALDVARGDVKWAWKGDGPAYASPVIAEFAGIRQVITQSQRRVIGLALSDGTLLWEIPFTTAFDQNSVTPIVVNDLLVYGGLSKPTTAVRIRQQNGKWVSEQVWQNPDVPMYMSSPVEAGGFLFGLTNRNRGQFFCIDAATGKTMWTTQGREGENAALVRAGDLLMTVTTEGELLVARTNPKAFEVVKRYTVADSPVWAHLVPVGGGLLIKDLETLVFWRF